MDSDLLNSRRNASVDPTQQQRYERISQHAGNNKSSKVFCFPYDILNKIGWNFKSGDKWSTCAVAELNRDKKIFERCEDTLVDRISVTESTLSISSNAHFKEASYYGDRVRSEDENRFACFQSTAYLWALFWASCKAMNHFQVRPGNAIYVSNFHVSEEGRSSGDDAEGYWVKLAADCNDAHLMRKNR